MIMETQSFRGIDVKQWDDGLLTRAMTWLATSMIRVAVVETVVARVLARE